MLLLQNAAQYVDKTEAFAEQVRSDALTVSETEYTEGLAKIALSAGTDSETLENYYGKDYIMESLLWDKVIEQIYDWAVVTEV